jgi:hypothetical protein
MSPDLPRGQFQTLDDDDDGPGWLLSAIFIAAGVLLPLFAWSHRPLELRTFGEATMASMRGDMVVRPPFFYGSFIVAAVFLVIGAGRLLKRRRAPSR